MNDELDETSTQMSDQTRTQADTQTTSVADAETAPTDVVGPEPTGAAETTAAAEVESDAFGDGPAPGLEHDARIALVTLMTQRFITRAKHPAAWDALLAFELEIRERLDDLFLTLELDRVHEVAFKRQVAGDGIPVLLRRDRALSRDASLLLIHLRQEHAFHDALDDSLMVSRDQVADFLNRFSAAGAHDQVQLDRRVDAALRALEQYHLIDPDPDAPEMLVVSPAVVPLVTPEVIAHLRDAYREATGRALGQADPETAAGTTDPDQVSVTDDLVSAEDDATATTETIEEPSGE